LLPLIEQFGPETNDSIDRSGDVLHGSKTFVYTLVPRSGGRHSIPSFEIPFFNPYTETYGTMSSPSFDITVTGSVVPAASNVPTSMFPVDDIAPPHDVVEKWVDADRRPLHHQPWSYLLLILPFAALTGIYAYRRRLERLATDERYAKSRRAHPAAKKHLKEAERLLASGRSHELYSEISRAVLGFVSDSLDIAAQGMTHNRLRGALAERLIPAATVDAVVSILAECERARFAPVAPSADMMNDVVERAARLIASIHEEVKQRGLG
jgi:hypothetical protein